MRGLKTLGGANDGRAAAFDHGRDRALGGAGQAARRARRVPGWSANPIAPIVWAGRSYPDAANATMTDHALTPRERRLRRGLVALAMVCALLVLVVVAVLVYWRLYLPRTVGRPVHPRAVRDQAQHDRGDAGVVGRGRRAASSSPRPAPAGPVTGAGGRLTGLEPGDAVRLDGVRRRHRPRVRLVPDRAARPARAGPLRRDRRLRLRERPRVGGRPHARRGAARLRRRRPATTATSSGRRQVLDRNIFDPLHDVMLGRPSVGDRGASTT